MKRPPKKQREIIGIVTARPCSCCGHHEIGVVTDAGEYVPLRPGMQIRIVDEANQDGSPPKDS